MGEVLGTVFLQRGEERKKGGQGMELLEGQLQQGEGVSL